MTEKRLFGAVKGYYREHIVDNTGRLYSDGEVADLLNEQHEQINTLRESRRELISANNEYRMRETELAQELSTLVDENEKLKKRCEVLETVLETSCKSI